MPHSIVKIEPMYSTGEGSSNVNKYRIISQSGSSWVRCCTTFEEAYLEACRYVNWDYQYIRVEIYPKEIRDSIDAIQCKRKEDVVRLAVMKAEQDYLNAKDRLEKYLDEKEKSEKI